MELYSGMMSKLIEEFASLPGIGQKTAQRLAFYIVNQPKEQVKIFADTMIESLSTIRLDRISWITPMAVLEKTIPINSIFLKLPTAATAIARIRLTILKRVIECSQMIRPTLLVPPPVRFDCPV